MRRGYVQTKLLHQRREPWRLALGQLEDEPRQRRGVDDRMLEWAFQPPPHKPCVERVVTVLDEHGALRKAQESPAGVLEFRRADEHGSIDVVAPPRVRVDRCAAVDERIEERERTAELETLGADLEDEERRVARGLDIEGDELGVIEPRVRPQLGRVDRDLLPRHRPRGAPGLEVNGTRRHRAEHAAERWTADLRCPCGRIASLPPPLLATRIDEYALLRCSAAPSTAATWSPKLSQPPLISVLTLMLSSQKRSHLT